MEKKVEIPKFLEIDYANYNKNRKRYKSYNVFPSLEIMIDTQGCDSWESDDTFYVGYSSYSFFFAWWCWYIEFQFNIITGQKSIT